MAVTTGAVIAAHQLTRRFRRGAETVLALDRVSLELYGGELTVAAGPSGSGKTTLLSILAGVERPDSGQLRTYPPLPEHRPPERLPWRHLGFVPQALALLDELTVAENVELPAVLDHTAGSPAPASAELLELLDRLEIGHLAGRYPSHTSGGEQQRTALARALRLRPNLLLGDEPTGHQDRARIELLLTVLRQHAYNGNAVLLASHDPAVIAAADRVVTLADGRIASDTRRQAHSYGYPDGMRQRSYRD
jgi:putative ABC transport system ATP-binding protein